MRADIHDGPEHMLQSETEYIDARPHQPASNRVSCTARPDHTFGSKAVRFRPSKCFPVCTSKQTQGVHERRTARTPQWIASRGPGAVGSVRAAAARACALRLDAATPASIGRV